MNHLIGNQHNKKDQPKSKWLQIRVTPDQKMKADELAKHKDTTISALVIDALKL